MRMNIRLIVAALVFALVFACSFVAAYRPIVINRKLLAGLKPRGSFSMSDNGRKAGGWSLSEATPVNYQLYKPVFSTDRILPIDFDKRIERFNKPSLWSDLMPRGDKFYSDETRFYKQIAYIKPRTSFASDDFDKRSVKKGFDLAYRKPKTSFASDSPKGGLVGGYRPTFSLSEFTGAKGFTNAYRTAFSLSDSESQHYKNWWWSLSDVLPAVAKKQSGFSMSDKKRLRPSFSMSDTSNRFKGGKYKPSGFSLSDERPRPSFSMSDRGVVQTQGKYRRLGWSMSDKNNRIVRPRPSFSLSDAPVVRRGENSAPVPLRCNHLVCRDPAGNAYVIRQA